MLLDGRGDNDAYTIHLTYPIDEIDAGREEDWGKQQAKGRARQKKNPGAKVRPNWSPAKQSLAALFEAHERFAKKVKIVDASQPHLIDVLDPVPF